MLRRRGVEPFDVVGQDFDPEWHEAVGHEPADGRRDGEITAEMRRGYRIGQRLLRPAHGEGGKGVSRRDYYEVLGVERQRRASRKSRAPIASWR